MSSPLFSPPDQQEAVLSARLDSLRRVSGGLAHDVNNVLTAVVGFGGLLAEQLHNDPAAAQNAREVLLAADRAAALMRKLLAFSGRQALNPTRVDVGALVNRLAPELERIVGVPTRVDVQVAPDLPSTTIDAQHLEAALVELATNAAEAMPDGGRLGVEIDFVQADASYVAQHVTIVPGPYLRLSVSDTGVGMTRDVQDLIFEPYFTTGPRSMGTGLGLPSVYGFIRQSGGGMWVYSEPGREIGRAHV